MADKKPFAGIVQEDSMTLLRQIFRILKPLGNVVGGGLNTLIVSLAPNPTLSGSTLGTVTTVSTVTTVTTVTAVTSVSSVAALNNIAAIGGVTAFDQMKSQNRVGYMTGPRSNLNWA